MDERTNAEKEERRAKYIKDFRREVPDDSNSAAAQDFRREGVTCCINGRTTRELPCLNPNYRRCPFRPRDNDYDGGRVRENQR